MAITRDEIRAAIAPYQDRRAPATVTADRLVHHCEEWSHILDDSDLRILQDAVAVLQRLASQG